MSDIIVAMISAASAIFLALVGVFGARKLGITGTQEKLIDTLKGLLEAQSLKIKDLEDSNKELQGATNKQEREIESLKSVIVSQVTEMERLKKVKDRRGGNRESLIE